MSTIELTITREPLLFAPQPPRGAFVATDPSDHSTEHLIACLEAWRALGGDVQATAIEAELVDRGVPYSDWREQEEVPA